MKDNIEKSLKRFLKRKAKITIGFITAFLITGSVGYSLSITESDLVNNTYTNNDKIEGLGVAIEDVGYEKVNIINNGEISEIGDGYYSTAFAVTSPYEVQTFIGNITNTGTISSYSKKSSSNGLFNGNGIGIENRYKYIEVGNITNSGTISGEFTDSDSPLTYSGNGIFLGLRNPTGEFSKAYIKVGDIINSGDIKGKIGSNRHTAEINGNGIGIFIGNDDNYGDARVGDSSIGNIINSGTISGSVERTFNSAGDSGNTTLTGNGIGVSLSYEYSDRGTISGNIDIGNITNTGVIKGEHKQISSNFGNDSAIVSGNGIGVITLGFSNYGDYGKLNLKKITNKGTISGNVNDMEANGFVVGNGIGLHGKNVTLTDDILNNGLINGNIKTLSNGGTNLGNGLGISANYGGLNLKNITNNGIISGKINGGYLNNNLNVVGNGIGLKGDNIKLADILNTGLIKGDLNLSQNNGMNLGNGIGITSSEGNIALNSIANTGILIGNIEGILKSGNGNGNGIGIHGKSVTLTADITNAGLIKGSIQNPTGEINTSGNGIGINAFEGDIALNNIKNNGLISGTIKEFDLGKGNVVGNGIGIFGNNIQVKSIENDGKIESSISSGNNNKLAGNGLMINASKDSLSIASIKNKGTIIGNNAGIDISKNNTAGELTNYSNTGVIAGKTPVYAQGFTDDLAKSADKGIAIKLDDNGNIASITNGTGGEFDGKTIINADIIDKDSSISVDKETNYANNIINGAGVNSATLNVNAKTSVTDSIINALKNAISDSGSNEISVNKSTINGNIALGKGDSKLAVTNSQINGDIAGGEGNDNLTVGGSSLYNKIEGFEDITFKGNTTLYETAKVTGANKIEIDGGTEVSLRVDSSKKANDGTYKEHALFNSSNKLLTLTGNTNAIGKDDVDENGNLAVEENEGRVNYDKVSILNLVTSGLGLKSKIDLGNTKVDDTLWVKTDSILTQATKQESDKGTILTIEAEKDLFNIAKKFDKPEPEIPLTPLEPAKPIKPVDPKPEIPLTPLEPAKPIKPVDPDKPVEPKPEIPLTPLEPSTPVEKPTNIKYYTKLNDIYKGIHSSNDKNFNALNDIVVNYTFSDKDKGNYPIIGNDKAQMETLLGYLTSVYTQNPYAFSNQATRKAMNLFHDSVRDNNFKANNDEWLIYGGLLHQSGDQEQTYYGRNYHGFDTGTADVDADIKLTGAYGQFEYGLSDSLATGIMVGGSKSEVEVGPSKVKGTGAYVGAYAKKDINNFRFTTGLGYQYSEYDGNRRTINEAYSSDYQDQAINLYVDGKYSHDLGNNLFLEPKAGLSYTHIDQDSIKENDKALALDIEAKDFDVLEGTVGVDIKKVIPTEKGTHTLTAGISYNHILDGDNAESLRANYGGSKFDVLVPHKNKGQVSLGAKYEVELENGMFYDVKGNYYVQTNSKDNSNKNADKGEWRVGVGFGYRFSKIEDLSLTSLFDFDKYEIKETEKATIRETANKLNKKRAGGTVVIEGHTDSVGTEAYNQALSEKRAKAVEAELKSNVTNKKISYTIKGYGETTPVADNNTDQGREQNRRVEVKFNNK